MSLLRRLSQRDSVLINILRTLMPSPERATIMALCKSRNLILQNRSVKQYMDGV